MVAKEEAADAAATAVAFTFPELKWGGAGNLDSVRSSDLSGGAKVIFCHCCFQARYLIVVLSKEAGVLFFRNRCRELR